MEVVLIYILKILVWIYYM